MDERYVKREDEKGHRSSSNGEHRHHHRHHKHHDSSHSRNRDKDGDRDHSEHRHGKRKDDHDRYDRDDRKRRPSPDRYMKNENSEKYERSDKYDRQIGDARPSRFDSGRPADRHEKDRFTSRETLDELRRERELKEGSRPSYRPEQRQQRPVPNNEGEDPLYKEWLAKEDDFMLSQAKKRAVIRVREGRAKPIDAFVVNLNIIEEGERDRKLGDDELEGDEFYITDADDVIKTLSMDQVDELKGDIHEYIGMEKSERNKQFWNMVLILLNDYERRSASVPESRAVSNVASDINALLSSKSYDDLVTLESQIQAKLQGDEPVDVDYWEQLLNSLKIWKARTRLREMQSLVPPSRKRPANAAPLSFAESKPRSASGTPNPAMAIAINDDIVEDNEDFTKAAQAMFDTEKERIVEEGVETEENFNVEADDVTIPEPNWIDQYKPRKPKFFNRVIMGYEWNKYNQTHYDEANPPPKVVQGYKFNIFYPNLVDHTKTPTYKVERNRQKRRYVGGGGGASAGEDDTCIIRFTAGPPYLDVAFRIIDRDWDYSSRFNRGFKSSFDKGILQLHFNFKKVFYRK